MNPGDVVTFRDWNGVNRKGKIKGYTGGKVLLLDDNSYGGRSRNRVLPVEALFVPGQTEEIERALDSIPRDVVKSVMLALAYSGSPKVDWEKGRLA